MASRRFVNNMLSVFDLEIAEDSKFQPRDNCKSDIRIQSKDRTSKFQDLKPRHPPHHRIEAYRVVGKKR